MKIKISFCLEEDLQRSFTRHGKVRGGGGSETAREGRCFTFNFLPINLV